MLKKLKRDVIDDFGDETFPSVDYDTKESIAKSQLKQVIAVKKKTIDILEKLSDLGGRLNGMGLVRSANPKTEMPQNGFFDEVNYASKLALNNLVIIESVVDKLNKMFTG